MEEEMKKKQLEEMKKKQLHELSKKILLEVRNKLKDIPKEGFRLGRLEKDVAFWEKNNIPSLCISDEIYTSYMRILRDLRLDLQQPEFECLEIRKDENEGEFRILYGGDGYDYKGYYQVGSYRVDDVKLEECINTIDIAKLGAEIGMEAKEQKLPNGKVVNQLVWDQENLLKAVSAIKHLAEDGKPVSITGVAPAWLVSALTHTVHPCPVSLYQPAVGKDIDIPQLAHGDANSEGEVAFKTTEKGNSVLVEYNMNLPEGITTYDENNLSKVVVPEIAQGKAVYLSGKGPNYLTVAIAEAYAHTNSSVSLFQPGVGYTCSITHSRSKRLGDLTKDPLGKEEVKEQLVASKETPTQEQSKDRAVESKEGPAID